MYHTRVLLLNGDLKRCFLHNSEIKKMNLIENKKLIIKIFLKTETNTFPVLAKKNFCKIVKFELKESVVDKMFLVYKTSIIITFFFNFLFFKRNFQTLKFNKVCFFNKQKHYSVFRLIFFLQYLFV